MRIVSVTPLQCSNGWATWTFVRIESDDSHVGYGECSDWQMANALAGGVHDLGEVVIGKDPRRVQALTADMTFHLRQNIGGVGQKALAGIEAALWDLKGQAHATSITDLLGGRPVTAFDFIGRIAAHTASGTRNCLEHHRSIHGPTYPYWGKRC